MMSTTAVDGSVGRRRATFHLAVLGALTLSNSVAQAQAPGTELRPGSSLKRESGTKGVQVNMSVEDLQGSWSTKVIQAEGRAIPFELVRGFSGVPFLHPLLLPTFRGNEWIDVGANGKGTDSLCTIRLEPSVGPKAIDLVTRRGVVHAIYRRVGDILLLCINADEAEGWRPTSFSADAGTPRITLICERINSPDTVVVVGARRTTDPVPLPSLPEVNATVLNSLEDAKVREIESLYASQLEMCEEESRTTRPGIDLALELRRNLRLGLVVRFDRWCSRDQKKSFSALILDSIRKLETQFQQRSDMYKAAAEKLTRQLEVIHERQKRRPG